MGVGVLEQQVPMSIDEDGMYFGSKLKIKIVPSVPSRIWNIRK
jgi:hypothetical protein